MKNFFLLSIFAGILLFLPTYPATANIKNPDFSQGDDGLDGWTHNELVSTGPYYPDDSPVMAAVFFPDDKEKTNPIPNSELISQDFFTIEPGSKILSFEVVFSESGAESGIFTAALIDDGGNYRGPSVDGLGHFFRISSDEVNGGTGSLNVLGLVGCNVKLVFNLYNDENFDTSAFLYNLSISPNTPVIPAPGAVLLGGIGVALVGWMRRRKQL